MQPQSEFYLFVPQDNDLRAEYEKGWKVTDIFPVNSVGIVTGQDKKTIGITQEQAKTLADGHELSEDTIKPILYRPFDRRFIIYDSKVVTRPRAAVMRHMVAGENLGLIANRQVKLDSIQHFFVSDSLTENKILETANGAGYFLPLYIYPNTDNLQKSVLEEQRLPNISENFFNLIKEKLGYTPTPEAIFYYIYAIFHSPIYRNRYSEYLKRDFPCIPLTSNDELFRQLADYGEQLVQLHLMTSPKLDNLITEFVEGEGDRTVNIGSAKTAYSKGTVKLNKKGDKFTGVPESVWDFYVGGYQVCHKWLKDRKGRRLSDEDILHYQKIVVALKETIELMEQIDNVIPGFPIK